MRWWFAALVAVLSFRSAAADPAQSAQVVIISIDGLRPEFYLPDNALATNCPTLVKLREGGSYAKAAISVYPSMTYPAHASISTGVSPRRHGILANTVFDPNGEEGERGYWFASDFKSPALWEAVKGAGLTVGAVSWPSTGGAKTIDWNLAEFWSSPLGSQTEMMRKHSTPDIVEPIPAAGNWVAWDEYVAREAIRIYKAHRPNLLLVHLIEPDKVQHKAGRDARDLPATMQRVDRLVAQIVAATGQDATLILLGDHGFSTVHSAIGLNWLLAKHGFITIADGKVKDWRAIVENTGGSATVHLKQERDRKAVLEVLRQESKGLFEIDESDVIRVEARAGYMFSGFLKGDRLVHGSSMKGNHGYLPDKPEMHTGFIIVGPRVKPGVVLERISLLDVAPTAAALLGVKFEGGEGRALQELLQSPPH